MQGCVLEEGHGLPASMLLHCARRWLATITTWPLCPLQMFLTEAHEGGLPLHHVATNDRSKPMIPADAHVNTWDKQVGAMHAYLH